MKTKSIFRSLMGTLLIFLPASLLLCSSCSSAEASTKGYESSPFDNDTYTKEFTEYMKTYQYTGCVHNRTPFNIVFSTGDVAIKAKGLEPLVNDLSLEFIEGLLKISMKDTRANHHLSPSAENLTIYLTLPTVPEFFLYNTGGLSAKSLVGKKVSIINFGTGDVNIDDIDASTVDFRNGGTSDFKIKSCKTTKLDLCLSGTGDLTFDTVNCNVADFMSLGTGNIIIKQFTAKEAYVVNSGTGDIFLSGISRTLTVKNSGTGDVNLRNMKANQNNIVNTGAGEVYTK